MFQKTRGPAVNSVPGLLLSREYTKISGTGLTGMLLKDLLGLKNK